MLLLTIFCLVDDFCKQFNLSLKKKSFPSNKKYTKKAGRKRMLSDSEVMTIIIYFHFSHYRTFKHFYLEYVCKHLKSDFPKLVSYNRFVELQKEVLILLFSFLKTRCLGKNTGLSIIDSTKLKVCDNRRIFSHKVFKGLAERGKSSTGWFYGFKLHLIINDKGEIVNFSLTSGNIDDRDELIIDKMTKNIIGKLLGDKGYISKKLDKKLLKKGIILLTKLRKNMKKKFISFIDKILLNKRGIIETVNGLLKNDEQIEHTRHRSILNFLGNIFSGLIAYQLRDKKPSIKHEYKYFLKKQKIKLCIV